jgi:hypothetical protein
MQPHADGAELRTRWPIRRYLAYPPMSPATADEKRTAFRIAVEQLYSFESGKINAAAMAEGRFAPFFVESDADYYTLLHSQIAADGGWTSVTPGPAVTSRGNSGIWIVVRLTDNAHRLREVTFYANPVYCPAGPDSSRATSG